MEFHSIQHWNWVHCVIEVDEFSTQGDNKAVKYRTAHLQWLLDNDVYTLNSMNEWQPDLRHWTPSSSARYPLRMKIPKPSIDPETRKLVMFHPTSFGRMCPSVEFTSLISTLSYNFPKKLEAETYNFQWQWQYSDDCPTIKYFVAENNLITSVLTEKLNGLVQEGRKWLFRVNFFSFKNAWIFACAFQLSSKPFSCIFILAGLHFVSEKNEDKISKRAQWTQQSRARVF